MRERLLDHANHRDQVPLRMSLWLTGSMLLIRFLEFTLCYRVVYPRLLRPGRAGALAAGVAGVVALFIGLRAALEEALFPAVLGFHNYHPGTTVSFYIYDNIYYSLPMLVVSAAGWAGQQALRRERENQQLRGEKQAAELAFLKTQINPHFLYNTLNLLYGMAYPVSKPLAAAMLQLADLMRYMLREIPSGQVELSQEIEYLENFLALYRLRFPNQFFADFTVSGAAAGRRLAPLLLIPLVENACKHGVLDEAAHPVGIRLVVGPEEVIFTVENRVSPGPKDATSGIGLANVRRRLALLYPGRHTLRTGPRGAEFAAELRLRA